MQIPDTLLNAVAGIIGMPRARGWAGALDFMRDELMVRWELKPDPVPGSPWAGAESLVIPVLTKEHYQAIIRFASPNTANPHAHSQILRALHMWKGRGAVRVIYEDTSFRATLQERLRTSENLSTVPLDSVAPIWGQLARALTIPGEPGFVRVQDIASDWLGKLAANMSHLPQFSDFSAHDQFVIDNAQRWMHQLANSTDSYLLHADLHYYNILAGFPNAEGVATWKAIDPQPLTGPAAYMVAPILWNRMNEISAHRPEEQAAWLRNFAAELCRYAAIDPAYGIGAAVAREVANMFWYLKSALRGNHKAFGDAQRSLWVARALSGVDVRGINAHQLKRLG